MLLIAAHTHTASRSRRRINWKPVCQDSTSISVHFTLSIVLKQCTFHLLPASESSKHSRYITAHTIHHVRKTVVCFVLIGFVKKVTTNNH